MNRRRRADITRSLARFTQPCRLLRDLVQTAVHKRICRSIRFHCFSSQPPKTISRPLFGKHAKSLGTLIPCSKPRRAPSLHPLGKYWISRRTRWNHDILPCTCHQSPSCHSSHPHHWILNYCRPISIIPSHRSSSRAPRPQHRYPHRIHPSGRPIWPHSFLEHPPIKSPLSPAMSITIRRSRFNSESHLIRKLGQRCHRRRSFGQLTCLEHLLKLIPSSHFHLVLMTVLSNCHFIIVDRLLSELRWRWWGDWFVGAPGLSAHCPSCPVSPAVGSALRKASQIISTRAGSQIRPSPCNRQTLER